MKRSELVKKVAKNIGYNEEIVDNVLKGITDEIAEELKKKENVSIFGFGKFIARSYGARKCYNPISGKVDVLKPSLQPAFIPGTKLRETLNK